MPSDTPYADAFVTQVMSGVPPKDILTASIIAGETELRRLFANERNSPVLNDPYIGLVDVFSSDESLRRAQARDIGDKDSNSDAKYVFPLNGEQRRESGEPAMAASLDQFRASWNVFTEGALSQLTDWNNVVAGGGAVLASLLPLPEHAHGSKRAIRKYFHENVYSTSDVDLFLYGLTTEQAEKKIVQIYEAVRDSVPWDTVCVRTKHAISIHSQYPYRNVQIILRLYKSPAEILAGFDIDCACFLYDGSRVWGNPRSITALMTQSNIVDMTRRSPSYEVRLAKYALRGFEVHVPNLCRKDVDPTIYERSINRIEGLARLLVLEKLSDPNNRTRYLEKRRALRGRPEPQGYSRRAMRRRKRINGGLKAEVEMFGGLNPSDYGTQSFHIPYGPGFDAKKLIKIIYSTDLGMNSTFNPKNRDRRLHRHPAFFGSITEVMEDCCEYCPEPLTEEEKELQVEEDKIYIRGRLQFMEEDPGRQLMTGSFHPIDEGEWSAQAYLGDVEKVFQAIANDDIETVRDIVEGGFDLKRRDHVGRTCLHLALLTHNETIASYLVDAGARITARLVDGRTSLHLAAQHGMPNVVTKLIERSKQNELKAEEEKKAAEALAKASKKDHDGDSEMGESQEDEDVRDSSEDDWDSDEDASSRKKKKVKGDKAAPMTAANQVPVEGAAIPEDDEELPDILDVNIPDWDFLYSPLCHAIMAGHLSVVDVLIRAGADVQRPFKKGPQWSIATMYPLTLTLLIEDELTACAIAERLIEGGASCTAADDTLKTVFHQAVLADNVSIVRTFLRVDPNANVAMEFMPNMGWNQTATPLVSAIGLNNHAMTALLLVAGSKPQITEEMFDRAWEARQKGLAPTAYRPPKVEGQWLKDLYLPVETALGRHSNLVLPLIELGADLNLGIKSERSSYSIKAPTQVLDSVRGSISNLETVIKAFTAPAAQTIQEDSTSYPHELWIDTDHSLVGWLTSQVKNYSILKIEEDKKQKQANKNGTMQVRNGISSVKTQERAAYIQLEWLKQVEKSIVAHGGKTRFELYPSSALEYVGNNRLFPLTLPGQIPIPPTGLIPAISTGLLPVPSPASIPSTTPPLVPTTRLPVEYKVYRANGSDTVPAYLTEQYAQLFEACWKGDHATVEKLCLPPKDGVPKKDAAYLQVTALIQYNPKFNLYKANSSIFYPSLAMSTLAVAIAARQWNTAKVILAIASAQYEKVEGEEPKYRPEVDSDDDSDDDVSMDSDDDEKISKPVMIDLARRMSTVKVPVEPKRLFEASSSIRGLILKYGTPIDLALQDADLDTLKHVLELGELCEPKQSLLPDHIQSVLVADSPEILDFVIRRYGYGIPLEEEEEDETETDHRDGPKVSKAYLGLNVNGKKRKDLASRVDPDAPPRTTNSLPIIWRAAQMNKLKILSWLTSSAPLEAYRYYMSHSTHENSKAMKRIKDFEQRLPALLGATITDVGENVVVAYLHNNAQPDTLMPFYMAAHATLPTNVQLDTLRHVFSLFPGMKTTFVHGKLGGSETTALHQICGANLSKDVFDFFLEMGADPLAIDFERRNIIHHLVNRDAYDLLVHVCTKLNNDQLATLFSQQTKSQMNTPLHLAVNRGRLRMVELLTAFDHPVTEATLMLRNAEGSTALHIAISSGFKEIASLLLDQGLSGSSTTLFMENGIGSTPLEIVSFLRLLEISNSGFKNQAAIPPTLNMPRSNREQNLQLARAMQYQQFLLPGNMINMGNTSRITSEEARALDQLLQSLDAEGRFIEQSELRRVLFEYAASCHLAVQQWEEIFEQEKSEEITSSSIIIDEKLKEIKDKLTTRMYLRSNSLMLVNTKAQPMHDTRDIDGTYKLIKSAVESSPFKRRRGLVHLLDVQKAVNLALDVATRRSPPSFQFGQQVAPYQYLSQKQKLRLMKRNGLEDKKQASYRFLLHLGWLVFDA